MKEKKRDIPVNFFTPNRLPEESRPFFELPPPLFVAVRTCRWNAILCQSSLHPLSICKGGDILEGPANSSCFNSEASPWTGSLDLDSSDDPSMMYSLYSCDTYPVGNSNDDFGVMVVKNTEIGCNSALLGVQHEKKISHAGRMLSFALPKCASTSRMPLERERSFLVDAWTCKSDDAPV
jgi:hypothetical protein